MNGSQIPSSSLIDDLDLAGLRVAALRAALELDLFSVVDGGANSVEQIAHATGSSTRGIAVLVNALRANDFLAVIHGRIVCTPVSAAYLSDRSLGDSRGIYLEWMRNRDHLVAAIRSGEAVGSHAEQEHGDGWKSYAAPDLVRWPDQVPELIAVFGERGLLPAPGQAVLDLGCGSGIVGLALICDVADATCIAVDRPEVLDVARQLAEAMGVAHRVQFIPGDASSLVIDPDSVDVALLVNVSQYLDDDRFLAAARAVRRALRPGGAVFVRCPVTDPPDDPEDTTWATLLEMYLSSSVPQRSESEVLAVLSSAGFDAVEVLNPGRYVARRAHV